MSSTDFIKTTLNTFRILRYDQTMQKYIWNDSMEAPIPRYEKSEDKQKERTKSKAEVFTPTWVVKEMVDLVEKESSESNFRNSGYRCLEICCGEAPFVTTRYEPDTGEYIPVNERVGMLDRKLSDIEARTAMEWIDKATLAVQDMYAYEYQIDSLMIARVNVLKSMEEHFMYWKQNRSEDYRGYIPPMENHVPLRIMERWAEIISWNIWNMDGLTGCIPNTDTRCKIMDWDTHVTEYFPEPEINKKKRGKRK